jgi:hypothetical protein
MLLQFDVLEAKVKLQIEQLGKQLKPCKALVKIPGIGWLGATIRSWVAPNQRPNIREPYYYSVINR